MQDRDQDKTTNVDENPSIFESITSQAGPSGQPFGRPNNIWKTDSRHSEPTENLVEEIGTDVYLTSDELESSAPYGRSFQEDFEAQMK